MFSNKRKIYPNTWDHLIENFKVAILPVDRLDKQA